MLRNHGRAGSALGVKRPSGSLNSENKLEFGKPRKRSCKGLCGRGRGLSQARAVGTQRGGDKGRSLGTDGFGE